MSVLARHHVTVTGQGDRTMLFAHGYGCDQTVWRFVAPAFADTHRVVCFDHAGAGHADPRAYDPHRHATLDGYADDVLAICAALAVTDAVFVGHSVSAMVGVLAAIRQPHRFGRLVLLGPSPRYIDDGAYRGGFSARDIDELLALQEHNLLGWAEHLAPVVIGAPERPALAKEWVTSACRVDPVIARQFAAVTFLGDNRADLPRVPVPALVIQCRDDAIAPLAVGAYVHEQLPDAVLTVLDVVGHCPHLSDPEATVAAIRAYLDAPPPPRADAP